MYRQQFFLIVNILMLVDGLILMASGYPAYILSLEIRTGGLVMAWFDFLASVLFLIVANNYIMGKIGFYSERRFSSYWTMIGSLVKAVSLDFIALSTVAFLLGIRPFPRVFVASYFFITLILLTITRVILYYYLDRRTRTAFNSRQILLIGTQKRMALLVEALEEQRSWGHHIAGCLNVDGQLNSEPLDIDSLGELADFDDVLQDHPIDEVIFALPRDFPINLQTYVHKCERIGVSFKIVPGLFDIAQPRIKVESLQGIPTLASYSWSATASGLLYKRLLDLLAGLLGFLGFVILYPIVGLAIKLDSPGPVLFKQQRVARNNRPFNLYKFRSMYVDAEARKQELLEKSEMSGPMFKMENDPRITRVGRFLRRTSLDEFPQFFNVLKGEMSLVGTRPPTPDEVKQYEDWHRRRISIKPGITGLWQISGRSKITEFSEVVKLDLEYIDNWRFWKDMVILYKTIWVALAKKGAK